MFDEVQSKLVFEVVDATLIYVVLEKLAEPAETLRSLYGLPEYVIADP